MKRLFSSLRVAGWAAAHAADKPNIVLFRADDPGNGDLDIVTCKERDLLGVIWYENPQHDK